MPEGDTVWRAARRLDAALSGRVLEHSDFRVPTLATTDLVGDEVRETISRGKHLLTRFAGGLTLHTHLKMEGRWDVHPLGTRWRRPAHTARVVLRTDETEAVGFALGIVALLPTDDEVEAVGHLGPDLLGPDWDAERALANLVAAPERPVGEALLDQRVMAGVGNVFRNELCFLAGVAPGSPVATVRDPARLVARAKAALEANKDRSQRSTTGDLRPGRRTWVHGQRRCGRCGSGVRTAPDAQGRLQHWCPSCQPD